MVVASHTPPEAGAYGDPGHDEIILAVPRTAGAPDPPLGHEDRKLMTAVVNRAEVAGKPVKPAVILTDDPQSAQLRAVRAVGAGTAPCTSGPEPPDAQLDRLVASWNEQADGQVSRLTIRLIAEGRDERRKIGGGSRIPIAADDDGETVADAGGIGYGLGWHARD